MRFRNVFTVLGLGAFTLVGMTPDEAQGQLFRRGGMRADGSASYYQPQAYGYGAPVYAGGYAADGCHHAYGIYNPPYGGGMAYGAQTGGYNSQPMGYGAQPMPGYSYGVQPMPGYAYGTQPQPMPGTSSAYPPAVPMPGTGAVAGAGTLPPQPWQPGQPWQPPQPGQPGQPGQVQTVNANDNVFEPKTITIRPGTVVTWTNRGQNPHTVTFPDVNRDSGSLPPGASFTAVFPYVGTYNYHCRFHQDMTATVIVEQATGTGTGTGTDTETTQPRTTGRNKTTDRSGTNDPDKNRN